MTDQEKTGFVRRMTSGVKRYGVKKVRLSTEQVDRSRSNIKEAKSAVREALTPAEYEVEDLKAGLRGRYDDGGSRRFLQQVEELGLTLEDLEQRARAQRIASIGSLLAGLVLIVYGFVSLANHFGLYYVAVSSASIIMGLVLLLNAIRHDYMYWQVKHRRFGGLVDYFQNRL